MNDYGYDEVIALTFERRLEQVEGELELKNKLVDYYKCFAYRKPSSTQKLLDQTVSELNRIKELYAIQQATIEALSKNRHV